MVINESPTLSKYKQTLIDCLQLYLPVSREDLDPIVDYSINKRYHKSMCIVDNTYTNKKHNMTLLKMADYIMSKEPILTAHGTMFMKHADCPNPLGVVIQQFLDLRGEHKKTMFKFPKGSEDFEKYNLLQSLTSRDLGEATLLVKLS